MNWDKPYSEEDFIEAMEALGHLGYKFKKHHTGKSELLWTDLKRIDPELDKVSNLSKYQEYLKLCKVRNSKLYKALK